MYTPQQTARIGFAAHRLTLVLPSDLIVRVRAIAGEQNVSMNKWITDVILKHIGKSATQFDNESLPNPNISWDDADPLK